MSNLLESSSSSSSSSSSDESRYGLEAEIPPSVSSLIESLCSENFGNLIVAAEKLAKEQPPAKISDYLDELKCLPENIRKVVGRFSESFYISVKCRGVMHKADAKKLWKRVESEFYTAMTSCDQLTVDFQHLAREIHDGGHNYNNGIRRKLQDSFDALRNVERHLERIRRLILPNITFLDRLRTSNVIVVNHKKFLRQLNLARMSNILTVFLFHKDCYVSYVKALEKYIEVSEQYHYEHGEDEVKFIVAKMGVSASMFKVREFPTVVVIKGDKEVGRVSIADAGFHYAVFIGLKLILDSGLAEEDIDC